jgi:hypothetical protein
VSLDGNQYYFVAYAYDPNYVFALPIHNLRDDTILKAFDNVFQELKMKGLKPTFNVTDNQAAQAIKTYLNKENTKWQFVEPNNHRVNAAERAIQTYKNHFISGLCTTDKDWPLQLWDTLTQQALITLNLLRTPCHHRALKPSSMSLQQHVHPGDHEVLMPGIVAPLLITIAMQNFLFLLLRVTASRDHMICSHSIAYFLPSLQINMYMRYMLNFLKQSKS